MSPSFPGGPAGAGLLFLRVSVAVSLLFITATPTTANWLQLAALAAAVALMLGVQARMIAALTLAAPVVVMSTSDGAGARVILHAINASALMLLGPGAFSADALLFGRRRLRLPDPDDTQV